MLEKYTSFLLRHPKTIVLLSLLIVSIAAIGLKNLKVTNDFRVYFSEKNPQLKAFENLEQTFSKQDNLYFLIIPKSGNVFSESALTFIWNLSNEAWTLPYSTRVDSITNFQYSHTQDDKLTTEFLLSDPSQLNKKSITRISLVALSEPALTGLVAQNKKYTGVNVRLQLPPDNNNSNDEVLQAAEQLLEKLLKQYPNIDVKMAGAIKANVTLRNAVEQDLQSLVILSYIVIFVGLILLLRSFSGTIATMALITFSVVVTFGLYGWLNFTLTPVAGFVPSVVMTIAVADSVHVLISYYYSLRQGMDKKSAIKEAMRINASPIFITSITTMIGVLCLNFSDSPPYQDLGNMVAFGVLLAYLFSMSFLPCVLAWLPASQHRSISNDNILMDRLANFVIRNNRRLIIIIGCLVIFLFSFISRNELTERWHNYFDDSFEVRQAIDLINEHISGVHAILYMLDSGASNGINNPEYIKQIDHFSQWYKQQPGIANVTVLSDTIKRITKNMHNGDPSWFKVPDSPELVAQYLLLYELSLPIGLGLENTINMDRSATKMIVIVKKTDSERLLELDKSAQRWLQNNANLIKPTEGTGIDMVFAHINHRNIRSLLFGTGFALVLISLVLIIALRSIRLGIISLIPNLAPAALAYGAWGIFVGRIDLSASIVICMSLGIVVDDTVHFLSKYLRARREHNLDIKQGMIYAFNTVGVALSITTIVLVSGFMVLAASHFSPTWVSGLLLSITLAFALLVDFFLLPPLLMILDNHAYAQKTLQLKNGN